MKRASGILMHVSSLPGGYSVGSFGISAKRFIDFLSEGGFEYWQVLPFCMPDRYGSPYKSHSAFGANPWFVDLPTLYEKGLITAEELRDAEEQQPYLCEFERLMGERLDLLRKAAWRVNDRKCVEDFIKASPHLKKAAEFMALKVKNLDTPWQIWTINTPDDDELFFWQFVQYEFYNQWRGVLDYAHGRGVKIIGDIPIYVCEDSSDVWANREQFLLDAKGYPLSVAGVPPDYFAEEGQLWGNPLYNYPKMQKDGYLWWKDRINHALTMFDGVRIDHFRGFESFWSVDTGANSAKDGKWIKGPGMELVSLIRSIAGDKLVIAEDLGDITPEVQKLVSDSDFPGMRVFQFGFLGDKDSPHMPHNYPAHAVAYTGTHDNNTTLGYIFDLDEKTRRRVFDYIGYPGENLDTGAALVVKRVLSSHADLTVLPIQDILLFGKDTRMNTPGSAAGNWRYRITSEQLRSLDGAYWRSLNSLYGRIR